MTLKIDLDSDTRKSLETEANRKGIEAEDLAAQLVARGLSSGATLDERRLELLGKLKLSNEEQVELELLQSQIDQRFEQLELERLDEVERMEQEVEAILNS